SGLPAGLTIDPATGLISGSLSSASAGTYQVTVTVSDGPATASHTFTWTITSANSSVNNAVMSNHAAPIGSMVASASNSAPTLTTPGPQVTATDYAATVRSNAPVQYLRLGEPSGAMALDASGIGRTGTYRGAIGYAQPGAINDGNTGVALGGIDGTYIDAGP